MYLSSVLWYSTLALRFTTELDLWVRYLRLFDSLCLSVFTCLKRGIVCVAVYCRPKCFWRITLYVTICIYVGADENLFFCFCWFISNNSGSICHVVVMPEGKGGPQTQVSWSQRPWESIRKNAKVDSVYQDMFFTPLPLSLCCLATIATVTGSCLHSDPGETVLLVKRQDGVILKACGNAVPAQMYRECEGTKRVKKTCQGEQEEGWDDNTRE